MNYRRIFPIAAVMLLALIASTTPAVANHHCNGTICLDLPNVDGCVGHTGGPPLGTHCIESDGSCKWDWCDG